MRVDDIDSSSHILLAIFMYVRSYFFERWQVLPKHVVLLLEDYFETTYFYEVSVRIRSARRRSLKVLFSSNPVVFFCDHRELASILIG